MSSIALTSSSRTATTTRAESAPRRRTLSPRAIAVLRAVADAARYVSSVLAAAASAPASGADTRNVDAYKYIQLR